MVFGMVFIGLYTSRKKRDSDKKIHTEQIRRIRDSERVRACLLCVQLRMRAQEANEKKTHDPNEQRKKNSYKPSSNRKSFSFPQPRYQFVWDFHRCYKAFGT